MSTQGEDLGPKPALKGRILAFDWKTQAGVISGFDGNRYEFSVSDWRNTKQPAEGDFVDFVPDGYLAHDIYMAVLPGYRSNESTHSKRLVAGILAILLGSLGIHKFLLGYHVQGVILLVVTLIGLVIIIGPIITTIIGIAEGIIYLTKTDEEFDTIYVRGRRE